MAIIFDHVMIFLSFILEGGPQNFIDTGNGPQVTKSLRTPGVKDITTWA